MIFTTTGRKITVLPHSCLTSLPSDIKYRDEGQSSDCRAGSTDAAEDNNVDGSQVNLCRQVCLFKVALCVLLAVHDR